MTENADPAEVDVPADDAPDPVPDRTFSQADLDRIVKDRLARQRAQFADYDDLKERAAKLEEFEQAQKTELEKAQERAAQLEKNAEESAKRAQEALLRAAVVSEASKKNVVDPDAAVTLLNRSLLEFDADGAPSNVADAIDALLADKPYLAGKKPTGTA